MNTWIYVFDSFRPVDIDISKLFTLAEEDPIQLFNQVKEDLEDLGEINDVKVHDIYFNVETLELLIEYIVECSLGEISVKLIYSKKPERTLINYYNYEKPGSIYP